MGYRNPFDFITAFAKLIREDFSFLKIKCQTHFLKHYR